MVTDPDMVDMILASFSTCVDRPYDFLAKIHLMITVSREWTQISYKDVEDFMHHRDSPGRGEVF